MKNKKQAKRKEQRKLQQKDKKTIEELVNLKEKMMKVDPVNTPKLPFPIIPQKPPNPMFLSPLDILGLHSQNQNRKFEKFF